MIEELSKSIPKNLLKASGSVFYSGRNAFSGHAKLYILGINPGGDPDEQASETIEWHTQKVLKEKPDWSAYRDESWKNAEPGTSGMQPRVLHLFSRLNCSAGDVPASNVIFTRSRREQDIESNRDCLVNICWPFHDKVISCLQPEVILCFGSNAGDIVRKKVGANQQIDEFVETNDRRWRSQAYQNSSGLKVIVLAHPSRAKWTSPNTDPTEMVLRVIGS